MMKRITSIKTLAARAAVTLLLALLTTVVGGEDDVCGVCAFFMPIPIVLPPYQTLMREL